MHGLNAQLGACIRHGVSAITDLYTGGRQHLSYSDYKLISDVIATCRRIRQHSQRHVAVLEMGE